MALNLGTLLLHLRADASQMNTGLSQAQRNLSSFAVSVSRTASLIAGLAGGAGLAGLAVSAVKAAAGFEQSTMAFTTMLGSGEKAASFLRDLREFAKTTPFEFQGLQQNARLLLAFGFQGEDILRIMTSIGEAISAFGGGTFEIDRVARALGQMRGKSNVMSQELNQLIEVGIPAWKLLSQFLGKTVAETQTMVEKGAVPGLVGVEAMIVGMARTYRGSMQGQMQTLLGQWSNAKDVMSEILINIGNEIIKTFDLKGRLASASQWLNDFNTALGEKGLLGALQAVAAPALRGDMAIVVGMVAALAAITMAPLALSLVLVVAKMLPLLVAAAALGAAAGVLVRDWDKVTDFFDKLPGRVKGSLDTMQVNIDAFGLATKGALSRWWDDLWSGKEVQAALANPWGNMPAPNTKGFEDSLESWGKTLRPLLADWWRTLFTPLAAVTAEEMRKALQTFRIPEDVRRAVTESRLAPEVQEPPKIEKPPFIPGVTMEPPGYVPPAVSRAQAGGPGSPQAIASALQDQLDYARGLRDAYTYDTTIPDWTRTNVMRQADEQIRRLEDALQTEIPTATPYAAGGIVRRPTLAMIGEAGPEAVVPLSRGGGFGGSVTINVNGVQDPERVAQMIVRRLKTLMPSLV